MAGVPGAVVSDDYPNDWKAIQTGRRAPAEPTRHEKPVPALETVTPAQAAHPESSESYMAEILRKHRQRNRVRRVLAYLLAIGVAACGARVLF